MPARTKSRKGRANFYRPGSNNVICDRSGFKAKVEDCRKEWNGYLVLKEFWEQRHPQDFYRGKPDHLQPQISRPGTPEEFIVCLDVQEPVTANSPPPTVVSRNDVKPEDL